MRKLSLILLLCLPLFLMGCSGEVDVVHETSKIEAILDDFHDAAAKGDQTRYLNIFAEEAMFLGTDESEHWDVRTEFIKYIKKNFKQGKGWVYTSEQKFIYVSKDGQTAWFDEVAVNAKGDRFRGTGAFIKQEGVWKMSHYSLTFLIPNDDFRRVAKIIKKK